MDTTTNNSRITPYSTEWFETRIGAFTASEIHKLMSEGKAKGKIFSDKGETYILEKVHELLSRLSKPNIANYATQWGVDNEPIALAWYAKLTGRNVEPSYLLIDEDFKALQATPDGFVGEDGLIEVKCPANGSNHIEHCFITSDEYFKKVHKEYYWQMQCQMLLAKRDWCDFVSFDPRINSDLGLFIYRLNFNPEDGELIEYKVAKAIEQRDSFFELMSAKTEVSE